MFDPQSSSTPELSRTREQFEKEVIKAYQTVRNLYEWRTKQWIQNVIKDIEEGNVCVRYNIDDSSGVKVLKIARDVRGKDFQIIPIDDYFDVIYAAHILTGHGSMAIVKEHLDNTKMYIPCRAIKTFVRLCDACNALKSENLLASRMYQGFVELIDMSEMPDGKHKFIIHYRQLKLRRVILRPLVSNTAVDVAEQLMEMFSKVGPPRVLHTPTKSFTKALILRLALVYPACKIICGKEMEFAAKTREIKASITKWMSSTNSNEWSRGINPMGGLEYSRKQLKASEEQNDDSETRVKSQPSVLDKDITIKKRAHALYLQKNISADEVFELLKPTKSYSNVNPQTIYLPQVPNNSETQKKVFKTYTRPQTEKPKVKIPLPDTETPSGKRAMCVDTNIREIAWKPSKAMKKNHEVWNSTLDLPDETRSNIKTIIGINLLDSNNFGNIPKESVDTASAFSNEVGQLSFEAAMREDSTDHTETSIGINASKQEAPKGKISVVVKEEISQMSPSADNFIEEKSLFEDTFDNNIIESKYIKEETFCIEESTSFDKVQKNDVKKENENFGTIIKVETVEEKQL